MKRLALLCGLSVLLYVAACAFLLDWPLSYSMLDRELDAKTARLAGLRSPKLVILAGSNGPYSHSCAVIGPVIGMGCENAGVAVGIGLDHLFLQDGALLRAGDVAYLPLELRQYTMTRAQNRAGADTAALISRDRATLAGLPPDRILGAMFCCNLDDVLEALAEMAAVKAGLMDPDKILARQFDAQGDHINTPAAAESPGLLTQPHSAPPRAAAIRNGYGTVLVTDFVAAESARGVIVIGGLPTDFNDVVIPPDTLAAIADIYTEHGGMFVMLPNRSEYPRADFFDSEDHLSQPFQAAHSAAVARLLLGVLRAGR